MDSRQHAVERVTVAVVDFAGRERLADRAQFVAGREERDAQLAVHGHLVDPERREHAEFGRPHRLTRAKHGRATSQVLAGEAAILAFLRDGTGRDRHAAGGFGGALLHDDRVRAGGHDAPGEDPHGFARPEGPAERLAGERLTDPPQRRRTLVREVGKANRPSIHRRVVVAGHVERRRDVGGEHAVECRANVHPLDRGHRLQELADQCPRAIDGHRIGIVVVRAGKLTQRSGRFHRQFPGCSQRVPRRC